MPKRVGLMLAGILAVTIPVILEAQTQSLPKFEVASVRPSPPLKLPLVAPFRMGMFMDGARVDFKLMSLRDLILIAYRIRPFQLAGTPDWMTTAVFDIHATLPQGVSTIMAPCASDERPCSVSTTKVPEMMQALLAERFGLEIRRENKEMAVYALVVAKDGPKFKESPPDDPRAEPVFLKPPKGGLVAGVGGAADPAPVRIGPVGGRGNVSNSSYWAAAGSLHLEIPNATMARLADTLTFMVDRPVVDRTGLTGKYEIGFDVPSQMVRKAVEMPMPGKIPRAAPPPDAGPGDLKASDPAGGSTIFQRVQSLGLRLENQKAAIETIVVEHIQKTPTEN